MGKLSEIRQNSITVASYAYNHLNQRISKTTPDSITHYHHDAQGRLWSETDGLGNTIRDYIWMGDMPVAMVDYPEGIERVTYLHADHLNTPRYGTNQVGDVVWQWQSDAFGNGLPAEDVDGDGVSVQVNLRFPGQYYDAESGLHYNYHRYYDPSIGRYITSDPIGLEGGLNTYAYVGGNPIRYIDPLGLMCYYNQGEGEMLCIEDESGDIYYDEYEYAYSGTWPGRNDPSWQEVMYVGPITRGGWTVGGTYNSAFTGNNTMVLIPWDDNSCFETGRECDTFRMHGNNSRNDASEGCIILPPNRTRIPYGEDIIVY